ncbi:two-component regulator propeller domain-containing protein [Pseudoalteromonas aurantia]|uniref:two-component regulator propeller domain-containing protein n=1 Tax=Pseudoalteromonas aurantia TaxID=43654 RepID=UPI003D9BFF1A
MRQGLPTGAVYSVFEDTDSMVWLGTNGEGACQYSGLYLRCLTSLHGLNNNRVWDIARM